MLPPGVIEPFCVVEDLGSALIPGLVNVPVQSFGLQGREEALHGGMIPAVASLSPLCRLLKVTALPHIGSATHKRRHSMAQLVNTNLLAALAEDNHLPPIPDSVSPVH